MKNVFVWLFFMQASFLFSVPQVDYSGEFQNVSAGDIIFRVSYNNHPSIYGPRVIYPGYRDRFLSSRGGTITKEYFTAAMKNLAASSGVSSVEKKKSYGLFSFYTGGLYPAIIGVEIEPPQGSPASRRAGSWVLDPPRIKDAMVYDGEGNVIVTFDDLLDDTYFNDSMEHFGHLIFKIDDAVIERGKLKYENSPRFNEQITNKPHEFYNIKVESETGLMYRINYKQPLPDGAGAGYYIADKTFANFFPMDNILRILYFDRNDEVNRNERFHSAFTEISICDTDGYVIIIDNTYKISVYSNIEYIITINQEDVDKGRIKYRNYRRITQRSRRR